jgi:putative phosphoribosyl transferase
MVRDRDVGRDAWAVRVRVNRIQLDGDLTIPAGARGLVLFAHGSGSSRHSPRNRFVAQALNQGGLATLLLDLLTPQEEQLDVLTAELRFDIGLLAHRLVGVVDWLGRTNGAEGFASASSARAPARPRP